MGMIEIAIVPQNQGNQLRNYGPSVWNGLITYRHENKYRDDGYWYPGIDAVRKVLAAVVQPFFFKGGPEPDDWYVAHEKELTDQGNGTWYYRLERVFND